MTTGLLDSVRVLDVAGEPAAMTGRILADLGAEVVRVEPREGDPLREVPPFVDDTDRSLRFEAWNAGKVSVVADPGDESLDTLLEGAHVVIDTPGWPGTAPSTGTVGLRVPCGFVSHPSGGPVPGRTGERPTSA
ncbi:MAG: CoA transferase [Acidimicrobiia bacterium]|nr:CoA transferase [Acidimicrobiia bacterium]